ILIGKTYPEQRAMEDVKAEAIASGRSYDELLAARFPGEWVRVTMGFVDEGNGQDTMKVRDFCASTADPHTGVPRFFPCKGVDWTHVRGLYEEIRDRFRTSDGTPITVYHLADSMLKRELYVDRIAEAERIRRKQSSTPALHLMAKPDKEFIDELTQEKRGPVMKKGRIVWVWLDPTGPNDFGDALKMALALWFVVRGQFTVAGTAQRFAA
ncbi:MAG TPA: terminase gpA endonuclease subunit, partial [Candidatus Synoicihabitans sp.]|nr:terminase gpA endonuclease subunit [Candidatus Synoicihabitans sp.]